MRIPFLKSFSPSAPKSSSTESDVENNIGQPLDRVPVTTYPPIELPPKLVKFQTLVGINSPNVLRATNLSGRPAPNEGIYKRTVDEEGRVQFQYRISNYFVNIGGMMQIVVGAALTALGAANGPSAVVTILGALNTVLAGMLTYLKGQGLPMRLEQYLHLLRTLREHIEERERELLEPESPLDVDEELQRVARMYQEIRQTAEDNAPGTVLPPRGAITSLLKKPDINRSDVMAPRGDKNASSMLTTGLQDLASFGHHAKTDMEGKSPPGKDGVEHGEKDMRAEISHLGNMAKDAYEKLGGHDDSIEKLHGYDDKIEKYEPPSDNGRK